MTAEMQSTFTATCQLSKVTGPYTCLPPQTGELGILLELGNIGAGHAATSLSDIVQQQIVVDVPRIHKIPPNVMPQYYEKHDTPTTAVYMQLNDSECDILLLLDYAEARKIAAVMTMAPSVNDLDPAMEESAITELGNIIIGAFLSAISDFTGIKLQPTAPQRIVDIYDTIMDNFLVKQSMTAKEAIIFDTHFQRAGEDSNSALMLFPSGTLQETLIQKSKEMMGV